MRKSGSKTRSGSAPRKRRSWLRPVLLLTLVVAVLMAAPALGIGERFAALHSWLDGLGAWGPVAFVAIYALASVLALPATPLTLAAGALFGSVVGVATVIVGATLGAALAFAVARWFARDAAAAWLAKNEKFRKLDAMTERHGAIIVAITRLVPIFPFNLLNFGFGLTKVPFGTYVLWSFVCMLPGTILYVVGGDVVRRAFGDGGVPWPLLAALGAAVALLVVAAWRARIALAKREAAAEPRP